MEITDKQRIEFCNTHLISVSLLPIQSENENISYEITYIFRDVVCIAISDTFTEAIDTAIERIKCMEKIND